MPDPTPTTTLPLTALLLLSLLALPGGSAATLQAETETVDPNPCRPYPEEPDAATVAWCTAKGIGNATVILFENVWDGNYTTLQDYAEGIARWLAAVESCSKDPSDPRCPALALGMG